ncbi:ectonucleotide pyrophosphatase/phosphodiesterase [Pseudoxanthomonas winnipegensis]|uniref:Alkaline phosphatase family protein n=1 Tax=Pseudoxanthomonas winnipegensis TaxID=2480810 RepID=A0A4V2KKX0_9GAMM|nr:ectonucleotide pyrophosphatase/phosphodiesterase [Pseudoxanthomonas winnipegensis]RZZ89029.1 alkaline phosphatase family protein [Pseudoxanthomonas winnipegensis]TAA27263.1 alkaline phosphatase family protein [Pseudoxanthomonas winnipegensis]TBV76093.1 alkaline phosphatase family protein [Pseudoxanthomonas winnipegensis]TBV76688.1 alkaline phosphatase family protein [Pseudoxanthomonas winnipegensis]
MFSSAFRAAWLAGLLLLSACASAPTRPASPDPVLLISIDALRASYLGRGDTPHLDALARDGVRAQWMTPSYPTLTFPNHYTLVTGQRPDHHGVIHNSMREAGLGEFKVADTQATGDARWWSEATPIWVTAEQHGLKTAIWAWPGSSAPIGGVLPNEYRLFDTAIPAAARAADVAGWLTGPVQARPALAALYMEDVDEEGHNHGPDSPQVREALRRVDAAVGALLDTLQAHGQLERTNIVIVSDHGMATVAPEHVIAVEDMVSKQEAVVVSVGQVVGVQPNPGFEAAVEARLLGRHPPYTCWRKGELPARWHYGSNARIPPIVCQMDEGWDALPAEQAARRRLLGHDRGSHGYDPALESMRAIFIAHGPAFRRGVVLPAFDNVDVYPLLARLLQVPPQPNDGTLAPLQAGLQPPAH